jgi:hypothetical protein
MDGRSSPAYDCSDEERIGNAASFIEAEEQKHVARTAILARSCAGGFADGRIRPASAVDGQFPASLLLALRDAWPVAQRMPTADRRPRARRSLKATQRVVRLLAGAPLF